MEKTLPERRSALWHPQREIGGIAEAHQSLPGDHVPALRILGAVELPHLGVLAFLGPLVGHEQRVAGNSRCFVALPHGPRVCVGWLPLMMFTKFSDFLTPSRPCPHLELI